MLDTLRTQSMKNIIDKLDSIKIKVSFVKDAVNIIRRQATEKIFAKAISNTGLLFKTYKELLKFNTKKTTRKNPNLKNGQKI